MGGHGPARGGGALRRRAGDRRLRGPVGAGPARLRGQGAAAGLAQVFRPVPNVDSVLLGLRRHGPAPEPDGDARWCTPRSPTGARRWPDRWRWPDRSSAGRARAGARGADRDGPPRRRACGAPGARGVPRARRHASADDPASAAPAKINLCLYLGPTRADGRHELVTLFDAVSLYRRARGRRPRPSDEVVCEGVDGPNLVADALGALRGRRAGRRRRVRVTITKRIPVAAGMGGGSADAAALLRLAPRLGSGPIGRRACDRPGLGADVPSQLVPARCSASAPGDRLAAARLSSRPTACSCSRRHSRWRRPTCTARRTAGSAAVRRWNWTSCAQLTLRVLGPN